MEEFRRLGSNGDLVGSHVAVGAFGSSVINHDGGDICFLAFWTAGTRFESDCGDSKASGFCERIVCARLSCSTSEDSSFAACASNLMLYLPAFALDASGNVLPEFIDQGLGDVSKPHRFRRRRDRAKGLFQIDRFDFVSSFRRQRPPQRSLTELSADGRRQGGDQ